MQKYRCFHSLILFLTFLFFTTLLSTDAWARRKKPHHAVASLDNVCAIAGLSGRAFGLCNAFCEAMDCDSDSPRASARACDRVLANFERKAGGAPPCLQAQQAEDADADGTPDGSDNCPESPNGSALGSCMAGPFAWEACQSDADCSAPGDPGHCSLAQDDTDGDGAGDVCDNCPTVPNAGQDAAACDCSCFDHTVIDSSPARLDPDSCVDDGVSAQIMNGSAYPEGGYFFGASNLGGLIFCRVVDAETDLLLLVQPEQAEACGALLRNSVLWEACP